MAEHRGRHIVAIFITFLCYLATLAIFVLQQLNFRYELNISMFLKENNGHNSTAYPFPTFIMDWSLPMWALCFLSQLFIMKFMIIGICVKVEQCHLYDKAPLFNVCFYLSYILALFASVSWLFLWDRGYIWISALAIFLGILCLLFSNIALMFAASQYTEYLVMVKSPHVYRSFVTFAINGINFYIAWLVCYFCLFSLPATLYEELEFMGENKYNAPISSSVGLNVLSILIIAHLIVDVVLFKRRYQYVFSPYIVFILVMGALLADHWNLTEGEEATMKDITTHFIQVVAMAALVVIIFVTKLVISCISCSRSAVYGNTYNLLQEI